MFDEKTLQIVLTTSYGSLLATFIYDYIFRNSVRLHFSSYSSTLLFWYMIANIVFGFVFIIIVTWSILNVWSKIRRNLLIMLIALIIIFIVRLFVAISAGTIEMKRITMRAADMMVVTSSVSSSSEALIVFLLQMFVHLFVIIFTWIFANKLA